MDLFIRGLVIGFSIAAPVGPIGILCIRRTLAYGRISGFVSGLGAATADAVYGCVAALGLTFISSFLIDQQTWFRLIGGAFLIYLGVRTFIEKPSDLGREMQSEIGDSGGEQNFSGILGNAKKANSRGERNIFSDYTSTFFLTMTNPMTILSFTAIFAGLGLVESGERGSGALVIVAGVFLGSASWWLILSSVADVFRRSFLTPNGLRWVNRLAGIIITGFGSIAILSLLL